MEECVSYIKAKDAFDRSALGRIVERKDRIGSSALVTGINEHRSCRSTKSNERIAHGIPIPGAHVARPV
jgi:hypothetical protein